MLLSELFSFLEQLDILLGWSWTSGGGGVIHLPTDACLLSAQEFIC